MRDIIKYEIIKSFKPFAILIILNLLSITAILLKYDFYGSTFADIVNGLGVVTLALYTFKSFYEDLYQGKYISMHITPIKTSKIFYAKTIVFFSSFILVFISRMPEILLSDYGLYNTQINKLSNGSMYMIFYILSKFAAYISGIILLAFSLAYSRYRTKEEVKGAITIGVAMGVIITMLFITAANTTVDFGNAESIGFMIGQTSKNTINYVQYAAFLPIQIGKSSSIDISTIISWIPVINNVILAVILLPLTAYFFNSKRYDVVGK